MVESNQTNTNIDNNTSAASINPSAPIVPETPNNSYDISKSTIAILVVLTLMISIVGTWTVLNEMSTLRSPVQDKSANSQGTVALRVMSDNPAKDGNSVAGSTGLVSLTISK